MFGSNQIRATGSSRDPSVWRQQEILDEPAPVKSLQNRDSLNGISDVRKADVDGARG